MKQHNGFRFSLRESLSGPAVLLFFLSFWLLPAAGAVSLCVNGVIVDSRGPLAIVNGEGARVGDTVQGAVVNAIADDAVEFSYEGTLIRKKIGEACTVSSGASRSSDAAPQIFERLREDVMRRAATHQTSSAMDKELEKFFLRNQGKVMAVLFSFVFLLYVYTALTLQIMAHKTATENGWLAWIPIANFYLMCMVAQKSAWWFLLLFIPYVNIIVMVMLWMGIAEARGKPSWIGILTLLPVVNLIIMGYLAFSE